jgi:tetratricopeptide (TPR) repeat protein
MDTARWRFFAYNPLAMKECQSVRLKTWKPFLLAYLIPLIVVPACKHHSAPTPHALAPASSAMPVASTEVLKKMLAAITDSGTNLELPANISESLGFTEPAQPRQSRQISAREQEFDSSAPLHTIAVGRDDAGDVGVFVRRNGTRHFFRIDRNGQARKGIALLKAGGSPMIIALVEAQSEVNAELRFWDANAERAVHWQVCNGDLSGANRVDVNKKIESCTWIIQSGKETARQLAHAYTSRGMAYERGQVPKELEDFNQAIRMDPTCARAWAQLCGVQNWITGETQLAIQSCSKAIELSPLAPEGWTFRGDIYLKNKDYDLAIADYDHAIELNPSWMWPLDNRGEAYLRKNDIDRAIEDFNAVIRVNPDHAIGFLDRGIAQMRKNDMDAAIADFQTGIKVDPHCASCLLGEGLVKRARGDLAGGDADIAKAKEMTPRAADGFEKDGIPVP